ncbi:MAG: glycosyltransferase [Ignavibacteriaceae bacterium]
MEILQIILFSAALLLVLYNLIVFLGLNRTRNTDSSQSGEINFSIIIAAKNEEKNIPQLISALKQIEYKTDNFEVIIIDDNSTDNTFAVCSELIASMNNYHSYRVSNKMFPGKKGVLNFGITKAKYSFILITDADCRPSPGWLKDFSGMFNKGYDFIFGKAPFEAEENIVNKISCFENLRSSILTFSFANIGFPYSATARNFGFKKSSFEKIEGYQNTTETLSGDDDLLLREAIRNKMKIGTLNESNSFVFSTTKKSLSAYLKQRSRHTKTSLYYLPSRQFNIGIWHLINMFCLFSPLFSAVKILFIIPFFIKILLDIITGLVYQKRFGYQFNLVEIFYLQILYEALIIINFAGAIFRKDSWN